MSYLEIKNVSVGFGSGTDRTEVLRDINLSVEEGEFVAILGYSGSGKSTLMNLLAGLVAPDSGEILVDGEPVTGPHPDRGLVFQNYSLLPWLTVNGNVALAGEPALPQRDAGPAEGPGGEGGRTGQSHRRRAETARGTVRGDAAAKLGRPGLCP